MVFHDADSEPEPHTAETEKGFPTFGLTIWVLSTPAELMFRELCIISIVARPAPVGQSTPLNRCVEVLGRAASLDPGI